MYYNRLRLITNSSTNVLKTFTKVLTIITLNIYETTAFSWAFCNIYNLNVHRTRAAEYLLNRFLITIAKQTELILNE